MDGNRILRSEWEWEGIVNDPSREKVAEKKASYENRIRAEEEARIYEARRRIADRRRAKLEADAFLYLLAMLTSCVVAKYAWIGGIPFLSAAMAIAASIFGATAFFKFGRSCEIGKNQRRNDV